MDTFPNNLKRLRRAAGLKQEDLAERLNVTRQTVSGWETGRRQPDLDTLKLLAEALDADVHELIYGQKSGEYPRFQRKYVIRAAVCGFVFLASEAFWFSIYPSLVNYHSPFYHPDAAKWMDCIRMMGSFALGMLLPAFMSLYAPQGKNQRMSGVFLFLGVLCSFLPLLLILSEYQLVSGLIAFLVFRLGMTPFGMFLLREALPFLSGILIFLGSNRE